MRRPPPADRCASTTRVWKPQSSKVALSHGPIWPLEVLKRAFGTTWRASCTLSGRSSFSWKNTRKVVKLDHRKCRAADEIVIGGQARLGADKDRAMRKILSAGVTTLAMAA